MACLLVHQCIENTEHAVRQELVLAGKLESTEAQERVETFPEAEILEGGFDIRVQCVEWLFYGIEAIAPDHDAQQLRMAHLLFALEGHRLAYQGILDRWRECLDYRARALFRMQHLLPERDRPQLDQFLLG